MLYTASLGKVALFFRTTHDLTFTAKPQFLLHREEVKLAAEEEYNDKSDKTFVGIALTENEEFHRQHLQSQRDVYRKEFLLLRRIKGYVSNLIHAFLFFVFLL